MPPPSRLSEKMRIYYYFLPMAFLPGVETDFLFLCIFLSLLEFKMSAVLGKISE